MMDKKKLIVLIGAYPDVGKGMLAGSIGYLFTKYGYSTSIVKFDGYFNIDSGNMNPYHVLPESTYSEEEVFVLKDGYEADADHGYYERFLDKELTGDTCITNGSLLSEFMDKIKNGDYGSGQILKYKNLRNLMKQKIYALAKNNDILILEVGGTIGDEETLQLYKALSEMLYENVLDVKTIMASPYLTNGSNEENVELSFRTKVTRKAFGEAVGLGIRPDLIVLRNRCEVPKNDIEYIASDCNISKEKIFLDPQLVNIYKLPEILEEQGLMKNFIKDKEKVYGRLELYNETKRELEGAPNIRIGIFGKTMSYDSYISLKDAVEHATVYNGINAEIIWLDDLFKNKEGVSIGDLDGLLVCEGNDFIIQKIAAIKIARELHVPLLAISSGLDALIKGVCADFKSENEGNLFVGSKLTKLVENSYISKIYNSLEISERYRINMWPSKENAERIGEMINITGISEEGKPVVFEVKGEEFCLGVKFHPEYKSRPGKPSPLFVEFLRRCLLFNNVPELSIKKQEQINRIKILIAERIK